MIEKDTLGPVADLLNTKSSIESKFDHKIAANNTISKLLGMSSDSLSDMHTVVSVRDSDTVVVSVYNSDDNTVRIKGLWSLLQGQVGETFWRENARITDSALVHVESGTRVTRLDGCVKFEMQLSVPEIAEAFSGLLSDLKANGIGAEELVKLRRWMY